MQQTQHYYFDTALLADGWHEQVTISIEPNGLISAIAHSAPPPVGATQITGAALPGMPNLHSHAHQRAMAGLAERAGAGPDSFWTWRETMYSFIGQITPDNLQAIAAQLYLEMLKAGYTSVGEFQYLHHAPDGQPYAERAEMSLRCLAAADTAGIAITCLPVWYQLSDFGNQPAQARQRRFINDAEQFLGLFEHLLNACQQPQHSAGIAPHSLRAVPPEQLMMVVEQARALAPDCPVHIHIAEQTKEVDDCLAWSGQRPVQWLLDHCPVAADWCLIHATHMAAQETQALAASGAVAGLCPTTEANLGDGFFPAQDYLAQQGVFGIGSDSHISVSPVEELRWLEYGQRLLQRGRNILAGGPQRATGRTLYDQALRGGAQAMDRPCGQLTPGYCGDILVLDTTAPLLLERTGDEILNSWLFAGNQPLVKDVIVAGKWLIRDGNHAAEADIQAKFRAALKRLAR